MAAQPQDAESPIESEVRRIRGLIDKHAHAAHPRDIEAMRLLGQLGLQLDVLDDAEFLLESVLAFAPDYHIARYDYAQVLTEKRTRAVRRAHYWPPNL